MLGADRLVTIVHHDKAIDGDSYRCAPVLASWHEVSTTTFDGGHAKTSTSVDCRVPSPPNGFAVSVGDKIALGALYWCDGAQFAALGRTHNAATVSGVTDNTWRACFPHLHIKAVR